MAKIRLTKNELKKQKDDLKRFTRYLPTLELKKKQLLQEIRRIQHEIDRIQGEIERVERETSRWVDVFADEIGFQKWLQIKDIRINSGNVAGIEIPFFGDLIFEDVDVDYFNTPFWIDRGIDICREQIKRKAELETTEEQERIIREELRITIQRIKLFEEVKIPGAKENIRIIRIFLGDQQTAEVVRGKIAKMKIEKKKLAGVSE